MEGRGVSLGVLTLLVLLAVGAGWQTGADPYRPQQWHLEQIGASTAWETSTGAGTVIAIVDTGVDLAHPDLVDRFLRDEDANVVGRDFVDDDQQPQDKNGHGTMVAGIATATTNNGLGVASVAPEAAIMPVRVLDEKGAGNGSDVDRGIRWAVDNGADVINLSLESVVPLPGAVVAQAPVEAVRYAWERGVVVVAATGNSSSPFTDYPDSSPVVLVGATDRNDEAADFSDSGRRDVVMAPGVDIVSTWCDTADGTRPCDERPERRYGKGSGTSFAAPQVSAVVAMLLATGLDHEEAVQRLRSTAEDLGPEGPDTRNGVGRVDAARAVGPRPEPAETTDPPDTGSADQRTPDPASPPATPAPSPSASVSPTPTTPDSSPAASPAPPAEEAVTTVPAPGTEIQGLEPAEPPGAETIRWLASALDVSTWGLVLVVRRELGGRSRR